MSQGVKNLTSEQLAQLVPAGLADEFFEALYGDAAEGAYDIELALRGQEGSCLELALLLKQRPGKCLACNLTYGLPRVFTRHPVLDLGGLVERICSLIDADPARATWQLGPTQPVSGELHAIPLCIDLGD